MKNYSVHNKAGAEIVKFALIVAGVKYQENSFGIIFDDAAPLGELKFNPSPMGYYPGPNVSYRLVADYGDWPNTAQVVMRTDR